MVLDNSTALDFVAKIASEDKGRTRPGKAIAAIEFLRRFLAIPALRLDPRTNLLLQGVLRRQPHTPFGALPFPGILVAAIVNKWGASEVWWKAMVAAIILTAFLALLRGAGVLSIQIAGVTWVVGQQELTNPNKIPRTHSGILLLLQRKTRQTSTCWVPVKAGRATALLARHIKFMRKRAPRNHNLFPARKRALRRGKRTWVPHPSNRMSTSSLATLMRKAISQVAMVPPAVANKFSYHALRVGGINYYRKLGVPLELRAQMADHRSLECSRRYLRLLPTEQFAILASLR